MKKTSVSLLVISPSMSLDELSSKLGRVPHLGLIVRAMLDLAEVLGPKRYGASIPTRKKPCRRRTSWSVWRFNTLRQS
jgi:hypothetical protein